MSYKMPIVCKEVYLPVDYDVEDITLKQYQEKYGIDLKEFLLFTQNSSSLSFAQDFETGRVKVRAKFYLVQENTPDITMPVIELNQQTTTTDSTTKTCKVSSAGSYGLVFAMPKDSTDLDDVTVSAMF